MRPLSPFKPYSTFATPGSPSKRHDDLNSPGSAKGKSKAAFVDVVIEGMTAETNAIPEAAKRFLAGLGEVLQTDTSPRKHATSSDDLARRDGNSAAVANILNELLASERSYINRLRHLQTAYAKTIKEDAKRSKPFIGVTLYEANALFGNIDRLLPLNEAFLHELELAVRADDDTWSGVILKHISGFEPYAVYIANSATAQDVAKKLSAQKAFTGFCESVKYSPTADVGGAGLSELLPEPFQRIARYPLLLNEMLKNMAFADAKRQQLEQASQLASDIARHDAGEVTMRAAEMHAVASAIADFPSQLLHADRYFLTSVDVKDVMISQPMTINNTPLPAAPTGNALHATLFLFNDVLVIAKRSANDKARDIVGLDRSRSLSQGPNAGAPGASPRKGVLQSAKLHYRGHVRLCDLIAVDEGSSLGLQLEAPPANVSAKWSGRPTRRYFADANDKRAFLLKLWRAQAAMRVRRDATTVLSTSMSNLAKAAGLGPAFDDAHVYYTIFSRAEWDREPEKSKTVVRLATSGVDGQLGFPLNAAPHVIVEAGEYGFDEWSVEVKERGTSSMAQDAQVMNNVLLAWEAARSAIRLGMCDVPPRHATFKAPLSPDLSRSRSPTSASSRLQSITDVFGPSVDAHRRTKSSESRSTVTSSIFSSHARSSTIASSFRSGSSVSRRPEPKIDSDADVEILAAREGGLPNPHVGMARSASADTIASEPFDGQPLRLGRSQSDQSLQSSQQLHRSPSRPTSNPHDVFGSPTSPRGHQLHGPRPSPSQRRKPVPQLDGDVEMRDSSEAEADAETSRGSIRSKRPRDDTPLSPTSTRTAKRPSPLAGTPPQRAATTSGATHPHSPAVRSPLGRVSPRRALTERRAEPAQTRSSPDRLLRDIDAAIGLSTVKQESMLELRETVLTYAPTTPTTASTSVVGRSSAMCKPGLTHSPKLFDVAGKAEGRPVAGTLEALRLEVDTKLDALLGGWEATTKQYHALAAEVRGYKEAQAGFRSTLASKDELLNARDRRILELERALARAEKREYPVDSTQLVTCQAELRQARQRIAELERAQESLDGEVKELYNAVNAECDRIFEDAKLPADEWVQAMQRDLKRRAADEVLLKYRNRQLQAALDAKSKTSA